MKFGKTLTSVRLTDERYGHYYMQYGVLKKHLKSLDSSTKEKEFIQMVDNELQRIKTIISSKLSEMKVNCESLHIVLHTTIAGVEKLDETAQIKKLEDLGDVLGSELAAVERFMYYNQEGFRKLIKKHDKITGVKSFWFETRHFQFFQESKRSVESLLVSLSDFYHKVREINEKNMEKENETPVSADTFERKSSKYWVPMLDVFVLKTKLIKHLPILLFNRKDHKKLTHVSALLYRESIAEFRADSGWISSVYFDNEKLECYRRRQEMEEGAALMRIRWYSEPEDCSSNLTETRLPRPSGSELFMERKTHHESWIGETSVKERFPIKGKDIYEYITGAQEVDAKISGNKGLALAQETQAQILKDSFQPFIRTVYRRAAFQRQETNDVRITLDTDLHFVNEFTGEVLTSVEKDGLWRRSEEDIEELKEWIIFPYAILEVKLKVGSPPWLDDILKLPFIRQVQKFSKFQHGCASFYPSMVKHFPYWFDDEAIQEAYKREAASKKKRDDDRKIAQNEKNKPASSSNVYIGIDNETFTENDGNKSVVLPLEIEEPAAKTGKLRAKNKYSLTQPMKEPKADTSAVSFNRKKEKGYGIVGRAKKSIQSRATKRVKVEPKTFFANERTFIQWLTASILLLTLGSALIDLGNSDARLTGFVIIPVAFFVMMYALTMYYIRVHRIRSGNKKNYHDYFGPTMLVFFLICAMIATITIPYLHLAELISSSSVTSKTSDIQNLKESKDCHRLNIPKLSVFDHPSDLLLDFTETRLWFVGGDCLLRQTDIASGNVTREIHVKDKGTNKCEYDLESLTWSTNQNGSSSIYLGSEKIPKRQVLEYDFEKEDIVRKFDVTQIIPIVQFEGLQFVEGFTFGGPYGTEKLLGGGQFIAAGLRHLISFGIDESTNPPEIITYNTVNFPENLLEKKVGAIRLFDDELYVLFDNANILLVVNLKSGQSSQYTLPGDTKEWEGIEITEKSSSPRKLYVYLAMDTPGQIWRFEFGDDGFSKC